MPRLVALATIQVKLLMIAASGTLPGLMAAGAGLFLAWRAIQVLVLFRATEQLEERDRLRWSHRGVRRVRAEFEASEKTVPETVAEVLAHPTDADTRRAIETFMAQHTQLGERSCRLRDVRTRFPIWTAPSLPLVAWTPSPVSSWRRW